MEIIYFKTVHTAKGVQNWIGRKKNNVIILFDQLFQSLELNPIEQIADSHCFDVCMALLTSQLFKTL